MAEIMPDVGAGFGTELAEFNGEASHVHLLVNFPPTVALSRLVNSLKGVSSRRLRGRDTRTCEGITGGRTGCGSGRTSPAPPAGPRCRSCASTSNSRTGPPDRLTSVRPHHRPEDRRTRGQLGSRRPRPGHRACWSTGSCRQVVRL